MKRIIGSDQIAHLCLLSSFRAKEKKKYLSCKINNGRGGGVNLISEVEV